MAHLTAWDRFILCLALLLISISYWYCWITVEDSADYVIIYTPSELPLRINLQRTQKVHIQGYLGESILEIDHGRIRFFKSPCHNQHCVQSGWLSKDGDFAVCIPNQVSIELHNSHTIPLDSISY
jgi:hypothetical protein